MAAPERLELPLDANFPEPILDALAEYIEDVRLITLDGIDARLRDLDDRQLIIALHQRGYTWLVTNNYKMLDNPYELAAVLKTKMTVFAIEGTGDDPLRATGALLLDLPPAVRRVTTGGAEGRVFRFAPRAPQPRDPWEFMKRAAERRHEAVNELYETVVVSDDELAEPLLDADAGD